MSPDLRKALLWGALAFGAAYFWGTCAPKDDGELDRQFQQGLQATKALHKRISMQDSTATRLDRQLQAERARRRQEASKADSLRGVGQALSERLRTATGPADSVVVLLGLVEALTGEGIALRGVVGSLQAEADSLLRDRERWRQVALASGEVVDSLTQTMVALRKASQCRIGPLPCPSRSAMLLSGTILGVVGTVLLAH